MGVLTKRRAEERPSAECGPVWGGVVAGSTRQGGS